MARFVYLAGPILGKTQGEANDWRKYVDKQFYDIAGEEVVGISPLRCEPIVGERYSATYNDPRFGTARAIGSKNRFDTANCDMVLAYLPLPDDGQKQSYGTIVEMGWGRALEKPVMLVTDDPYIREHPVINYCADWLFETLDEAIETATGILSGYVGGKNV